mmetsp:Transcript_101787/g.316677  ORF Transcript_101787/g.316677 Transcript_101787/m.316677 type:complete len:321 (+) Transcript_101787:50-1012(+)
MARGEAATSGSADYYREWDQYAKAAADSDEEEVGASKPGPSRTSAGITGTSTSAGSRFSGVGYEFRKGHKTKFPEIVVSDGETEESAALRVAGERRTAGVEAFSDGTVWGAQTAVDAWGQGLLAMERLRNLRNRRLAELEAQQAGGDDEGASGSADGPGEPCDDGVNALALALRLNIAQALLKLREFEACVAHCDKALELEPQSAKALWRRAKAIWGIRNPGLAREALDRLLEVDPGNPAAVAMLREIDAEEAKKKARRTGIAASRPAVAQAQPTAPRPQQPAADAGSAAGASVAGEAEAGASWLQRCCCSRRGRKEKPA